MSYFRSRIVAKPNITPRMVRITIAGDDLRNYERTGHFDEHFGLLFPHPGESEPVVPEIVDGREVCPEGRERSPMRILTLRRHDAEAGEIDIDFFLHEGGIATGWAEQAKIGDPVVLTDAHGHDEVPAEAEWRVLIGDSAALPAIGRFVEQLRPGQSAVVVGIVTDAAERQEIASPGTVEWRWIEVSDPAEIGHTIINLATNYDRPAGPGYFWVAGEGNATRAVRKYLRRTVGLANKWFAATGYWRVNGEEWDRRYHELADQIEGKVKAARQAAKDRDGFLDEIDRIYDEVGL